MCADYLTKRDHKNFYKIFEPVSDGCNIERIVNCWYDVEVKNVNTKIGIYGQPLEDVLVCPYPQYSITIQADGQVSVCFLDWNKKMVVGDVKGNTIKEIWNSEKFKNFQLMMLKGKRKNHPICKNCEQLKFGMPVDLDPYSHEILKRIQ